MKEILWKIFKKLPLILAVLVAPATIYIVVTHQPYLQKLLDFSSRSQPKEEPNRKESTPKIATLSGEPDPEEGAVSGEEAVASGDGAAADLVPESFPLVESDGTESAAGLAGSIAGTDPVAGMVRDDGSGVLPDAGRAVDWDAEAAKCTTAGDFISLAERAVAAGRSDLAEKFYLRALFLDPGNAVANEAVGNVRFDPAVHLEDFERFEGKQLAGALIPFRERKGKWILSGELARLRKEWSRVKASLTAELERRESDPHEELRRRTLRRLMRAKDFAKLIKENTITFRYPYFFFIESGSEEDVERAAAFAEVLGADLDHLLDGFEKLCPAEREDAAGRESADSDEVFFIWIDTDKEKSDQHGRSRMLIASLPEKLDDYAGSEKVRRSLARSFGRMIVKEKCSAPSFPEMWLFEGTALLLAAGKGFDGKGRLRLNGEGSEHDERFTAWIKANRGAWPIPLERLVAYSTLDELWKDVLVRCSGLEKGEKEEEFRCALAACRLFCHYLSRKEGGGPFRKYLDARLAGKNIPNGMESLLGSSSFVEVEREMVKAYLLPSVEVTYAPPKPGRVLDEADIFKDINALLDFIKANPNSPDLDFKKIELADCYFKAGRSLGSGLEGLDDQAVGKARKTEVDGYFKASVELYGAAAQLFGKQAEKCRLKKQAESADQWEREKCRLRLKTGIAYMFWKEIEEDAALRKGLLEKALDHLYGSMIEAPADDPGLLWAWFYAHLASTELERSVEAAAFMDAAIGGDLVDMGQTLSSASEAPWLVADPIEAFCLSLAGKHNSMEEWGKTVDAVELYFKSCRAAKAQPGPLGEELRLEHYKAAVRAGGIAKGGKILVEAARRNRGNRIGRMAIPLLEDLIDRCTLAREKRKKQYTILPEAILCLAHEYRMARRHADAVEQYDRFLQSGSTTKSRRFVEKKKDEALQCQGLCYRSLLEEARASGDKPGAARAESRLASLGVGSASLPAGLETPAPSRDAAFPPVGIFDIPPCSSQPAIVFVSRESGSSKESRKVSPAKKAVHMGLDWLARHQTPEGFWDCDAFKMKCAKGGSCSGKGFALNDVGVTGLALLAFLEDGHSVTEGPYSEAVRRGLAYLCCVQDPKEGWLGPREGIHWIYNHGIGTLALVRAYGSTRWPTLVKHGQDALDAIHAGKNPGKAWRYCNGEADPVKQNDVSVTGWMVRCLASGSELGFDLDNRDLVDALLYIDEMTDADTGRTGYYERGSYSSRKEDPHSSIWPYGQGETMTAEAMLCRFRIADVLGDEESQTPSLEAGARLLRMCLPKWSAAKGRIDYCYWYYGTESMHRMGGNSWTIWKSAIEKALVGNQRQDGCMKGSWDSGVDPWGEDGGRVYATAICTLALEVVVHSEKKRSSR